MGATRVRAALMSPVPLMVLVPLALLCVEALPQAVGAGPARQALVAAEGGRATVEAQLQIDVGSHGAAVRRLAVDVARDWVVSASDDKSARVWRLGTGEAVHTLRVPAGPGEQGRLYGAAIHPQRAEVVVAGTGLAPLPGAATEATAHVFALASGQWTASFRLCRCEVKRLAWSPDGRWLLAAAAGPERGVHAFDAKGHAAGHFATEGDVFGLSVHRSLDRSQDRSQDRLQVLATDMSGRLLVFPLGAAGLGAPRVLASPGPFPVSVSHSPDGSRAVVGHLSAQAPAIVELTAGRVLRTLEPQERGLDAGQLMTVAWSPDAPTVWVGGRKARGRDYLLWRFDADTGAPLAGTPVASDSILDLVPLPSDAGGQVGQLGSAGQAGGAGRVAFASFDGSWGVLDGQTVAPHQKSALAGAQATSSLLTGPDGTLVSWQLGSGERLQFDLRRRRLARVETGVGRGARMRVGGAFSAEVQVADARGFFSGFYRLGGREIRLEPGETARAATFVPGSSDAFVGTSRALQRVDASGQVLWRRAPGAEVNAVVFANAGAGAGEGIGERVITALSDGTVRWWHAASGEQLLAVLALPTGQWVAWTPEGYFDASAGGDSLAGWLVRAPGSARVEHHLLARFRTTFRRPDLVDVALGIAQAPRAAAAPAPEAAALLLPPQLVARAERKAKSTGGPVALPFALRGAETGEARVSVRLNGRPWLSARVEMPARLDGEAPGRAEVALPAGRHLVQLIARDAHGTSAPLDFDVQVDAAPPPPGARPRLLVLAVGVSEYAEASLNLGLAAKDATDFEATLAALGGKRYGAVTTRLMVDRQATRPAVLRNLEWLATEAGSDDVVIVFLAGHGAHDDEGRYHFITHEGDIARLAQTAISEAELRDALAAIRGRIVLFADTCHAGSVTTTRAAALSRDHARLADELRAPENGVIVLASSARSEESLEVRSLGNGIFTKAVVEGLRGRADLLKRGEITVKGLDYYVASQVAAMTKAAQNPVSLIPPGMPDFRLIELP
ncbi:MAG: caspase family protein [Burkholderiales bacterium]|nr:caspase family protein [Burkholderiales bacterium]